ncbi:MAG: hypothetical protein KatS3mg077_2297 [Candidatus Binatia bacterium]|nr:MAG: hypothetical protein KatS3mg077_2297 [Candidatus Binatia bacterium]
MASGESWVASGEWQVGRCRGARPCAPMTSKQRSAAGRLRVRGLGASGVRRCLLHAAGKGTLCPSSDFRGAFHRGATSRLRTALSGRILGRTRADGVGKNRLPDSAGPGARVGSRRCRSSKTRDYRTGVREQLGPQFNSLLE